MSINQDYSLFFKFIDTYSDGGFKGIDNKDLFMKRLHKKLDSSHQFFFVADLLKFQILYTSPQIADILGIDPRQVDPAILFSNTCPEDVERLSKGFNIEVAKAREIFVNKSGTLLLSSNFRKRKTNGEITNLLCQCYLFYSKSPVETVYVLEVNTVIDSFSKFLNGNFHWYVGNDATLFRYPDKELLQIGAIFSQRELEIIRYIQKGLKTKDIAQALFLSPQTISTHRRNILKKAGKGNISEVIFDMNQIGTI